MFQKIAIHVFAKYNNIGGRIQACFQNLIILELFGPRVARAKGFQRLADDRVGRQDARWELFCNVSHYGHLMRQPQRESP